MIFFPPVFSRWCVWAHPACDIPACLAHGLRSRNIFFIRSWASPKGSTHPSAAGWVGGEQFAVFIPKVTYWKSVLCQHVTLMSQAQMLGRLFFSPTVPCTSRKLFRAGASCSGVQFSFPHSIVLLLSAHVSQRRFDIFFSRHFQPPLACLKTPVIFFKGLILLWSACPHYCQAGWGASRPWESRVRQEDASHAPEPRSTGVRVVKEMSCWVAFCVSDYAAWLKCAIFLLLTGKAALMLTLKEITKESGMLCWRTSRAWR